MYFNNVCMMHGIVIDGISALIVYKAFNEKNNLDGVSLISFFETKQHQGHSL